MMPGGSAGFLVPLGALAAPIDDTIGPVARPRVFRGRLSIPKVIARLFSKSSCGAGHGDLVLSQQKLRTNNGKLQEKTLQTHKLHLLQNNSFLFPKSFEKMSKPGPQRLPPCRPLHLQLEIGTSICNKK